jgi:hypothetical protein
MESGIAFCEGHREWPSTSWQSKGQGAEVCKHQCSQTDRAHNQPDSEQDITKFKTFHRRTRRNADLNHRASVYNVDDSQASRLLQ